MNSAKEPRDGALSLFQAQAIAPDSDADGLDDALEAKLQTNPNAVDTDGDGLSDYDERCKYCTNPKIKDSDGDGKPDGDRDERREYAYTIQAICDIRPPNNVESMNDLYQDARVIKKPGRLPDSMVVEVILYPFASPHVAPQLYPPRTPAESLERYTQPTMAMNFSPQTQEEVKRIVVGDAKTDVEAVERVLRWIATQTRLDNAEPEFAYFHVDNGKIVWDKSLGDPKRDRRLLETNFYGESMFNSRLHGTCTSLTTLRATLLRAAGLPTRLVQTLPLINRFEDDPEPLVDRLKFRMMAGGYEWGPGGCGANHAYNEVFLNNHWIRVDSTVNCGPFVADKLFVKVYSIADWSERLDWRAQMPLGDGNGPDRDFRTLDVSDAKPLHASAETLFVELVAEDKDVAVERQPDGKFAAIVAIQNTGARPSPLFEVDFHAGDPEKGGRLLSRNGAGPIMPRGVWNEKTHPFALNAGEDEVWVVLDPDNTVSEPNKANNVGHTKVE